MPRISLAEIKDHDWVTMYGLNPLLKEEENCQLIEVRQICGIQTKLSYCEKDRNTVYQNLKCVPGYHHRDLYYHHRDLYYHHHDHHDQHDCDTIAAQVTEHEHD